MYGGFSWRLWPVRVRSWKKVALSPFLAARDQQPLRDQILQIAQPRPLCSSCCGAILARTDAPLLMHHLESDFLSLIEPNGFVDRDSAPEADTPHALQRGGFS